MAPNAPARAPRPAIASAVRPVWAPLAMRSQPPRPPRPAATMNTEQIDKMVKHLTIKDLRVQCRVRGVSPAGGKEALEQRLKEHMFATNDL
jgi:hypothetical protein